MDAGFRRSVELGDDGLAHGFGVHRLGEDLQRKDVVVAVDDEAGQEIGLAEDDAVGIGVADQGSR